MVTSTKCPGEAQYLSLYATWKGERVGREHPDTHGFTVLADLGPVSWQPPNVSRGSLRATSARAISAPKPSGHLHSKRQTSEFRADAVDKRGSSRFQINTEQHFATAQRCKAKIVGGFAVGDG
jgi:hypothetical protein